MLNKESFIGFGDNIYKVRVNNGQREIYHKNKWISIDSFIKKLDNNKLLEAAKIGIKHV